jgi:CO/xanthine dehydrogenase Mo-binding subunit
MEHFALSRREFLKVSIAGAGGMLMELLLPGFALAQTGAMHDTTVHGAGGVKPGVFIRIDRDSTVTVICPNSEMGQGAWTGVAQVIAEELDADWAKVRVEQSPTHPDYARPGLGLMLTGGSNTIRSQWQRFRAAGAAGRGMLLAAAAQEWKIDPAELRTDSGEVIAPDGRRLKYGRARGSGRAHAGSRAAPTQKAGALPHRWTEPAESRHTGQDRWISEVRARRRATGIAHGAHGPTAGMGQHAEELRRERRREGEGGQSGGADLDRYRRGGE